MADEYILKSIVAVPKSTSMINDDYFFFVNDGGNSLKQVSKATLKNYLGSAQTWDSLVGKPFTSLNEDQFSIVNGAVSIVDNHTHSNKTVIDLFSMDSEGSLTWNDIVVGGASIDDTSTSGVTVTWSASKLNSTIGNINTILATVTGGVT